MTVQFIESPEFGVEGGWRLLYRSRDDSGVVRETKVLPVRGLGVLMATTMSHADKITMSNTATINGVVLVEYLRPVAAGVVRVLHRELVTAADFNARQQKAKTKVQPGAVVSYNVGSGAEAEDEEQQQQQEVQDQDPGEVAGQQPHGQPGP